jgi:hypothetical protein
VCQDEVHEESKVLLPSSALQGSTWCENHDVGVPVVAGEVQWLDESVEEQERRWRACRYARDRRISAAAGGGMSLTGGAGAPPLIWCIIISRRISRICVRGWSSKSGRIVERILSPDTRQGNQ